MFNVRPVPAIAGIQTHDIRQLVQISANHKYIPLKEENWSDRWCTLPNHFQDVIQDLIDFEVRDDDVFVVTFMKCGTTWMQEAAWLVMNDMNFGRATTMDLSTRSPFIDMHGLRPSGNEKLHEANEAPSPRLLKSHLPMNLLPTQLWQKKNKIIYVARNVKDVVVSSYHFIHGLGFWNGSLDDFHEDFMHDRVAYTPFWSHIMDFWQMRNEPNIFFTTYEDMKSDLPSVLQNLAKFLDKPPLTTEQIVKAQQHLSFDVMKANKSANRTQYIKESTPSLIKHNFEFMRRGVVGSYKDELSIEQQAKLNEWSQQNLLRKGITESDIFPNVE